MMCGLFQGFMRAILATDVGVSSDVTLCGLVWTRACRVSAHSSADADVVLFGFVQFRLSMKMPVFLCDIGVSIQITLRVVVSDVRPVFTLHGVPVKVGSRRTPGILPFLPACL